MSLSRQDWLEVARHLMTEKGIEAVRVEVLARKLKVSKGSFYWHFKDRADLLSELLNYWASVTDELIAQGQQITDPQARLRLLFDAIALSGVSGEEVIHVWAKQDAKVAEQVHQVEARRMAYLQTIFEEAGFALEDARERAEITYLAFLGYAFKASQDTAFSLDFKDLGTEIIKIMFQERMSS